MRPRGGDGSFGRVIVAEHSKPWIDRALLGAYTYQFSNQLPQLIVLPIMAKVLDPRDLVITAKFFATISLINIVTDWGYSTLGSQKLFRYRGQTEEMGRIFASGEELRLLLWVAACGISVLVYYATEGISPALLDSAAIVSLGTLSWLLLPNWLIVGTRTYERIAPLVLVMRVSSIVVLISVASVRGDVMLALLAYFAVLSVFGLWARHMARQYAGIDRITQLRTFNARAELGPGLVIMLGTCCSFGFLSTGVFFVDRFGTQASAAAFVIADRLLASVRAAYAPLIQHVFVGIKEHGNTRAGMPGRFALIVVLGTLAVWVSGRVVLALVFRNRLAEEYFNILVVGFFFLGFSHYYVTLRTLGHGRAMTWLRVLFVGLLVYLAGLAVLAFGLHYAAGIAVSLAIVAAEITVFAYGRSLARSTHDVV